MMAKDVFEPIKNGKLPCEHPHCEMKGNPPVATWKLRHFAGDIELQPSRYCDRHARTLVKLFNLLCGDNHKLPNKEDSDK